LIVKAKLIPIAPGSRLDGTGAAKVSYEGFIFYIVKS